MRYLFVPFVLAVACGSNEPTTTTTDETESTASDESMSPESEIVEASDGRVENGFFMAEGAPDPLACTSDDECTHSGALGADGCCWTFREMNAVACTTAYKDWQHRRRAECDLDRCPPAPLPTRPPDCLFEVSCVDGRCANACP